jgi:hypothetical protein
MAIAIIDTEQVPATLPRPAAGAQFHPATTAPASRTAIWVGRITSAVAVAFLLLDGVIKVLKLAPAVAGTVQLGYPVGVTPTIGVIELICLAVYLVPRTAVLGAVCGRGTWVAPSPRICASAAHWRATPCFPSTSPSCCGEVCTFAIAGCARCSRCAAGLDRPRSRRVSA